MTTDTDTKQPMIYGAMASVMADIGTVGKTGTNRDQGYKFRSIEDVMSAVRAGLTKHGVFYLPTVLTRLPEMRQTGGGKPMNVVHLEIRYDFYTTDGSSVSSVVWGEGADMADKSTNKAMSQALKYNLVQAFSIAAEDMQDADRGTTEAGPGAGYRSAGAAFDNASATPPGTGTSAEDWVTETTVKAAGFATEDDGRELWREVAAKATARSITRDDAKVLQDLIQARIADLRDEAKAVEGTVVSPLDPADEWAAKVETIADDDEAAAARADVEAGMKAGHIAKDRGAAILAAIGVRLASLGGQVAA